MFLCQNRNTGYILLSRHLSIQSWWVHYSSLFYKILYFLYRYDSGIFILRFMQSYDGTTVQKISNVWFLTSANSYVHYKVQIVHCKSNSSIFFISIVNTYVHYRLIYYHFGRSFSSNFYLINTTSSLIDSLNC